MQAHLGKRALGMEFPYLVLLILAQRAGGMVPHDYTGSSIYVALGQELRPQGNDASSWGAGYPSDSLYTTKGSLDLLAAYWISVLI